MSGNGGSSLSGKVWQISLTIIIACFAIKLVISIVVPLIPALIVVGILLMVGTTLYNQKRRW